jgi:hypothetical protein
MEFIFMAVAVEMKTGSQLGSVANVTQKLKRRSNETRAGDQSPQINPISDIPLIGMI